MHTIPSNLLVGDVSLGIEHLYKKRISQELQAYVKCFSPVFLRYDKGFRVNYQLKYNFIRRSYFRMSVNLSASYKEAAFTNKKDYRFENREAMLNSIESTPTYLMDRKFNSLESVVASV